MNQATNLDCAKELIPILWELTEQNKKCSFNISTQNGKIFTTILLKNRQYHFCSKDKNLLIKDINEFVEDCKDCPPHYYDYLRYKTSLC